mgnify:CR=1 FL=1
MRKYYLAIDIGASSGRHIVGWREDGEIKAKEVYRFPNGVQEQDGHLIWDIDALLSHVKAGIAAAKTEFSSIISLSIDTWGVDYVLLRGEVHVLPVYAYRDSRTEAVIPQVYSILPFSELYRRTGIQFQPFNTIYQLYADKLAGRLEGVTDFLMLPEYLLWRLCGMKAKEYTNATTTQLVNINSDDWDESLLAWSGANKAWFGRPTHPGNVIGHWICPQGNEIPVVAVASHDTASAVIASPLNGSRAAYLSSGTWSLMGFESQTPFTNDTALAANITNEGGAEGRYRVLKNIMGLWLLQRVLQEQQINDLPALISATQALPACRFIINPNDDRFINPEAMCSEIQAACRETAQPIPESDAELARCIFDSLALLYADVLHELAQLRGEDFSQLHIVGGGCQNTLLNQLCADACGIRVIAGPVEASTLGNIGIQLMTLDELNNVDDFRQVVSTTANLTTFTPNPDSEIAHYVAQIHSTRQTKELCA